MASPSTRRLTGLVEMVLMDGCKPGPGAAHQLHSCHAAGLRGAAPRRGKVGGIEWEKPDLGAGEWREEPGVLSRFRGIGGSC